MVVLAVEELSAILASPAEVEAAAVLESAPATVGSPITVIVALAPGAKEPKSAVKAVPA
jgi:hypothetical protein